MKKYYSLLFPAFLAAVLVVLSGFGGGDLKSSGGAPPGYTNSPFDNKNCSHCMGGTATPVSGWITSTIPSSGYVLGQTYNIIVSGTGTSKKGFQLSPQDPSGALIGVLTPVGNTKLVGFGKYITHTTPSQANPTIWTFQWTAPSLETGDVVFYASIALGKTDTRVTTYTVSQSSVGIGEKGIRITKVGPNPAHDRLTLSFILPVEATCSADLLSLSGKSFPVLVPETLPSGSWTKQLSISVPAGLYILRLHAGGTQLTEKIVVI
jgi:hypothetical protein